MWQLVEDLAEKAKASGQTVVDMAELDVWELLEQIDERERGHRLPKEYVMSRSSAEAEARIIKAIWNEDVDVDTNWDHIRLVSDEEYEQWLAGNWPPKGENEHE